MNDHILSKPLPAKTAGDANCFFQTIPNPFRQWTTPL